MTITANSWNSRYPIGTVILARGWQGDITEERTSGRARTDEWGHVRIPIEKGYEVDGYDVIEVKR